MCIKSQQSKMFVKPEQFYLESVSALMFYI